MRELIIIIATAVLLLTSCEDSKCIKSHEEKMCLFNYYGTQENDIVTVTVCDSSIKIK